MLCINTPSLNTRLLTLATPLTQIIRYFDIHKEVWVKK